MLETSEHEDLFLRYAPMVAAFDASPRCYLVALDGFDISLLLSVLRYTHWPTRWGDLGEATFEEINERMYRLEDCLMSGCDVSALISAIIEGFSGLSDTMATVAGAFNTVTPGCTSGGTEFPAENGEEGGEPPSGYDPPDEGTEDRKCKASNMLYDGVVAILEKLQVLDVEEYAELGFVLVSSIVGAILASEVPIAGTLVGAVAGAIASSVVLLATSGAALSIDDLLDMLSGNHADIVCAFYDSLTAEEARGAALFVLEEAGATWPERQLVGLCLPNNLVNLLFFTLPIYESILDQWECSIDCAECAGPPDEVEVIIIPGSPAGSIEWDDNTCIVTSEYVSGAHRANFQCSLVGNPSALRCAWIGNLQTTLTFNSLNNWIWACNDWQGFLPKPFEQADVQGFKQLALAATASFTFSFTFLGEYEP